MSEPNSQTHNTGIHPLHRFRSDRKHLPLHPLEKAVLTVVALHLCFLPWALGAMHVWSQLTSMGISILGFGLALIPRHYSSDLSGGPDMRLTMWPRLLHFPLFWLGLALLAYIAIQGFNPSWVWERNATTWWLRRVNDIPWLPTSIDTPFERFNLWRQFIIYASAWLMVCTIWVGFTRRRSLQLLLLAVVASAAILAMVGFVQRGVDSSTLVGLMQNPADGTAFASFVYRNHAGAYFALMATTAAALAFHFFERGLLRDAKSTPAGLFVLCVCLFVLCVLFTYARGAALVLVLFLGLLLLFLGVRSVLAGTWSASRSWTTIALTVIIGTAMALALWLLDFSKLEQRFDLAVSKKQDVSIFSRTMAYDAALDMLADHGSRGVGAGGFRYLFPEYIKHYPQAYLDGRLFWEHAHCDWLQVPIELGTVGVVLLVLGASFGVGWFRRRHVWRNAVAFILLLGSGQTFIHATFDFPMQCPAVLITWLALIGIAGRWVELDSTT